MDTNTYNLLMDYKDNYYPVYSLDILETLMEEFISSLPYTSPIYLMNMCDVFYDTLYRGPVTFGGQPKEDS